MNWASNLPPLNLLLTKQETKAHIRAHLLLFGMKRLITVHHIIKKIKAHSDRIYNLCTYICMDVRIFTKCLLFDDMYLQIISRGVYSHNVTGK